jgi:hypothetical protein
MIHANIGRDQVFRHPREVVVPVKELTLVLAEGSFRLSKLPLPSVHVVLALAVFHNEVILVHQLDRIV